MGKRRGPPPLPTALKKLAGNPGKRKLNRQEPILEAEDDLRPPSYLNALAREEWRRVAPALQAAKVITKADRQVLAGYCHNYSRWRECVADLNDLGEKFASTKSGYPAPHPLVAMEQQYYKLMVASAQELGITPASRTRVSAVGSKADDPDADFLDNPQGGKAASAESAYTA